MAIDKIALQVLRNRAAKMVLDHGLPKNPQALQWLLRLNQRDTTPEEAFAPLYAAYFAGSGEFSMDFWMQITSRLDDTSIRLSPQDGGIEFSFGFEFDNGDTSPGEGERNAHGTI